MANISLRADRTHIACSSGEDYHPQPGHLETRGESWSGSRNNVKLSFLVSEPYTLSVAGEEVRVFLEIASEGAPDVRRRFYLTPHGTQLYEVLQALYHRQSSSLHLKLYHSHFRAALWTGQHRVVRRYSVRGANGTIDIIRRTVLPILSMMVPFAGRKATHF